MSNKHKEVIRKLLNHIYANTCTHDETYRGGILWEICSQCGAKWADDEGGKPDFEYPQCVKDAEQILFEDCSHKSAAL